jgi:hypothetical protein
MVDQMAQPIVEHAIDDQMDPLTRAPVLHAMREGKIEIPTFARLHCYTFSGQIKLDVGIGHDGDMKADLTQFLAEIEIGMFADDRAGRQTQQPHGFQRASKRCQDFLEVRARLESFGGRELGGAGARRV